MREKLNQIKKLSIEKLTSINCLKELDNLRVDIIGKKGELTQILKGMGGLSAEERPIIGQLANEVRSEIENKIEEIKTKLINKEQEAKLKEEKIDVTIPAKIKKLGHKHPMTQVIDNIKNIFIGMGYEIAEGPEVETAYYNFEALNIPENHPARDEQDTFYINGVCDLVLRTQTSPVQVRVMEKGKLPIKIIAPGRVYRSDEVDATHSPIFHQLEGLVIDKNITMGDLKGALSVFAKELFGEDTKVRFRPHHFPFTEPSAEMDASCFACGGKGCRVCKGSGWIEVLGCGMVHPKVLEMAGIDPKEYSGFAFGMGLERVTMQKFAITDLRLLFENDVKFLNQF
ncbi:MAG: phenylalanine--tRNA ligase subunit alpha [Eubacteriales bacterium]|nr:phenylalanine--tRNA ligase subunit alpha [Eubacteriales bacterium]